MRFATELVCWKCGASLAQLPLPLSRLAECPQCRAYLHCCRLCEFHNPRLTGQCDETRAEEVRDRESANFCDWFRPRPDAHRPAGGEKTAAAKARLDALFGGASKSDGLKDEAQKKLDEFFGHRNKTEK